MGALRAQAAFDVAIKNTENHRRLMRRYELNLSDSWPEQSI
ncbi:hypothetical protein POBR111598_07250 [Polynucleobacter brandtiae]